MRVLAVFLVILWVLLNVNAQEVRGDVNGDYCVNAADITETISYIMGNSPAYFNEKAADVNYDGLVNIADIVLIVDIIMNTTKDDVVINQLRFFISGLLAGGIDNIELSNDQSFIQKLESLDTPNPIEFRIADKYILSPCLSIIDDDTEDYQIPSSMNRTNPTANYGGFFSVLLPLTLSLKAKYNKPVPVGLACEGHRVGLTSYTNQPNDDYSTLNTNGLAVKWLHDNQGWNVLNHSMKAPHFIQDRTFYVDGINSLLATTILANSVWSGLRSVNNTCVFDRLTKIWYEPNQARTEWVRRDPQKCYGCPFYREYINPDDPSADHLGPIYFNRDFDFDYSWGEWFKRADELGLPNEKAIVQNGSSTCSFTISASRKYAYFCVNTRLDYNIPPLAAAVSRTTAANNTAIGYNLWDDEWVEKNKELIDESLATKNWIVYMSHVYEQEYFANYYLDNKEYPSAEQGQPALRAKDDNYPSEWIVPLNMDEILDIIGDNTHDYINHPPSRLKISSWSEWHPAGGTQLAAFYYILDYAMGLGIDIVTPMDGWNTHGNILNLGVDRNGQRYVYESAQNQTPLTNEEKSYLTIGADMSVRFYNNKTHNK